MVAAILGPPSSGVVEKERRSIPWDQLAFAGLLLVALWLYLPPYQHSFIGDDFVQQWRIREFIEHPARAYQIFSPYWTDWYYRPLQNIWILANRLLFGVLPPGYYYLQLCWHLLAVCLLYQLARRLRVAWGGAFIAAALFAVNGQNHLTVDWISSIGNIISLNFTLLAMITLLSYLRRPERRLLLPLVIILSVLALLAHELSIALPFLLVALWYTRPGRRPLRPIEIIAGLILAAIVILYIYLQVVRPNANISAPELTTTSALELLLPQQFTPYLFTMLFRWSSLNRTTWALGITDGLLRESIVSPVVAIILLVLVVYWFRRGKQAIRLGLLWLTFSLGFVYVALWSQEPERVDGRHLYYAWAGLSLAIGSSLPMIFEAVKLRLAERRQSSQMIRLLAYAMVAVIAAFLFIQARQVGASQTAVLNLARRVERAEKQMKQLLPELNEETQLYAKDFILTAPYFVPTAAVWYNKPDLSGGSFEVLKSKALVTEDTYVFDYDEGDLYNLMPELQRHRQTILLWRRPPVVANWLGPDAEGPLNAGDYQVGLVTGPAGDRRLAIMVPSLDGRWTSIGFESPVPGKGQFAVATLGARDDTFRVRLLDEAGSAHLLFESTISAEREGQWQDFTIPISQFGNQSLTVLLEHRCAHGCQEGGAYWANPRLVVD